MRRQALLARQQNLILISTARTLGDIKGNCKESITNWYGGQKRVMEIIAIR